MIESKDLRIGNYFLNNKGETKQVLFIMLDVIVTDIGKLNQGYSQVFITCPYNLAEPIALTPEIIKLTELKGFRCATIRNGGGPFKIMGIVKNGEINSFADKLDLSTFGKLYFLGNEIKYLHHLQNLIQSLTGEELTISI